MYEDYVIIEVPKNSFSDNVGNLNNDIRIDSNVTFSNPYKITLDDNGATTGGTKELEVYYGSSKIKPSTIILPKKTYVVKYNANGTGIQIPSSTSVDAAFNGWFTALNGGNKVVNNTTRPSFIVSASSTSSDISIVSIASDFREVSPGKTAVSINHVTYSSYKYAQCVAGQYGCKNPQYSYLLVCVVVSKNGCANQTFCKYRRAEDSTLYNGYGY